MDNKRTARTKGYLKKAMTELLRTQPFEDITIKAICARADVNRSTFYAYYSCRRDLIDEIEKDILSQLPEFDPSHKSFLDSLIPFMQYIKDNGDTFRVLMSASVDSFFAEELISAVMDKYSGIVFSSDKEEGRMELIFCINGVSGIVKEWMDGGFQWPVERISSFIATLVFRSTDQEE